MEPKKYFTKQIKYYFYLYINFQHILLQLNLTVNSYYEVGKLLSNNFKNIFACLECGYKIEVLPHCVSAFLLGINNQKMNLKFVEQFTKSAANVQREFESRIKSLKLGHDGFWDF